MHSCRPLPDHTSTITVQAGWEEVDVDFGVLRVPIWKRHTTQWSAVVCGHDRRATDPNCPAECPAKHTENP